MSAVVLDPASVLAAAAAADAAVLSCGQARSALSDVSAALSLPADTGWSPMRTGALGDAVATAAHDLDDAADLLRQWARDLRAAVDHLRSADASAGGGTGQRLVLTVGRLLEPAAALAAATVRVGSEADGLLPPVPDLLVRLPGLAAREVGTALDDGPGWAVAAGSPPDAAGLGATTATPLPGAAGAVDDLLAGVDALAPGTAAVVPVRGTDGVIRYVVELRGVHAFDAADPEDFRGAFPALVAGTSSYAGAIRRALDSLCLPRGSELLLAGHSLGGITALDLAGDPAFNGAAFRVRQVLTAGSPVSGLHPRPGTAVLEIDNADDLVPHLDLRDSRAVPGDGDGRAVAVFTHQTGSVGGNHSLGRSYEPFVGSSQFLHTPGVPAWLASASPFLTGTPLPGVLFSLRDSP